MILHGLSGWEEVETLTGGGSQDMSWKHCFNESLYVILVLGGVTWYMLVPGCQDAGFKLMSGLVENIQWLVSLPSQTQYVLGTLRPS